MIKEFLDYVALKNPFQQKYLLESMKDINEYEYDKLNNLLNFYSKEHSIEEIGNAYLKWVEVLMQEQIYFTKNACYRHEKLDQIKYLYEDSSYMTSYMMGLGVSTYLWNLHRDMMRFFITNLKSLPAKGRYLEIGPGHGEHFVHALEFTDLDEYVGVDISDTSVEMTKAFITHSMKENTKKYYVINKDFFEYTHDEKFDVIVMGEVLEHVEKPLEFLKKIYDIASDEANIYITTAINAPQPDHLYLFSNVDEVKSLLKEAKLEVVDEIAVTTNNMPLEKAIKKKRTVTVAFILTKCK